MYSRILNPKTGKYVNVKSNRGKHILNNYVNMIGGTKKSKADILESGVQMKNCTRYRTESDCKEKPEEFCHWDWENNRCTNEVRDARRAGVDRRTKQGKRLKDIEDFNKENLTRHSSMRPVGNMSPNSSSMRPLNHKITSNSPHLLTPTSDTSSISSKPSIDQSELLKEIHSRKKIIGPSFKQFGMPEEKMGMLSTKDIESGYKKRKDKIREVSRGRLNKLKNLARMVGTMKHRTDQNITRPTQAHGHLSRHDLYKAKENLSPIQHPSHRQQHPSHQQYHSQQHPFMYQQHPSMMRPNSSMMRPNSSMMRPNSSMMRPQSGFNVDDLEKGTKSSHYSHAQVPMFNVQQQQQHHTAPRPYGIVEPSETSSVTSSNFTQPSKLFTSPGHHSWRDEQSYKPSQSQFSSHLSDMGLNSKPVEVAQPIQPRQYPQYDFSDTSYGSQ